MTEQQGNSSTMDSLWLERCPVCKAGALSLVEDKMLLGLLTLHWVECDCGAIFHALGGKYRLVQVSDESNPVWQEYAKQSLTGREWRTIALGGMSDEKLAEFERRPKKSAVDEARETSRNLRGIELEKAGRVDEAVALYEANVNEECEGSHPYNRLAVIYRSRKQMDDEIRVLERAVWVFDRVVSRERGDRVPKLRYFRGRLAKARRLKLKQQGERPPDLPEPLGAVCPYCDRGLEKRPKRKTKCPHCDNYIYVRTSPSGNGSKVLVTEDGAKKVDKEWDRVHFREKWLQQLEQAGLSDQDFSRHKKTLGERFRQEASDSDVIWSMFNEALHHAMKSGDFQELKMLYLDMALFLYEEGRDFFRVLQQSRNMELTGFKQAGWVEKVLISTGGQGSCEACQKLEDKVFTVDEALEQMPIPCKDCTFDFQGTGQPGWCRCWYSPVAR